MKKISTAAALLAAGALLFGSLIVACSPHGTGIIDEVTPTPGKGPQETFDKETKVDVLWNFTTAATLPTGVTATLSAGTDFTNIATLNDDTTQSGTGVSLKFIEGSASKFKVTTEEPTKGAGIYVTGGSDAVANYAKSFKGKFELKLKYKANVKVTVAGNGSNDGRWLVVANSSGTKLHEKTFASEASTLADAEEIDLGEVPGGIYTVYALGCRIFKVSAKNNVSTVVPVPITGVTATAAAASINVGGTTKLTATVTPSTTTENKTVTWEVKEGSANIELSATTGEEITVTGKAAGTAKIVAKAGTFTSSEVTVTVTADTTVTLLAGDNLPASAKTFATTQASATEDYPYFGTSEDFNKAIKSVLNGTLLTVSNETFSFATPDDPAVAVSSGKPQFSLQTKGAVGASKVGLYIKDKFTENISSQTDLMTLSFKVTPAEGKTPKAKSMTFLGLNTKGNDKAVLKVSIGNKTIGLEKNSSAAKIHSLDLENTVISGETTITVTLSIASGTYGVSSYIQDIAFAFSE